MRDLVVKGSWWLPGNKEQKIQGTLYFSEKKGCRLFLDPCKKNMPETCSTILGLTLEGEKITLFDCCRQRCHFHATQQEAHYEYEYESEYVFMGIHFDDIPFFTAIEFKPNILEEWVDIDGFISCVDTPTEKNTTTIKYRQPDDINLATYDGCSYSLIFRTIHTSQGTPARGQGILQEVFFRLDFEKAIILHDILMITRALMNMLSFTADKPVHATNMRGFVDVSRTHSIEVYTRQNRTENEPGKQHFSFLFRFKDAQKHAPQFLEKWIDLSLGFLSPFTNNYIAEKYIPSGYIDRKFLEYVRCLEVFHRKTSNRKAMSDEEFCRRLQYIENGIQENKINRWVKGKLKYANELTLQDRLQEIARKYGHNINLFSDYAVTEFCEKITNERHYLTHYEEKKDIEHLSLDEMAEKTIQMKKLIDICVLISMGFDQSFIDELFDYEIPLAYKIMAVNHYIDNKSGEMNQPMPDLKEDAEYLLTHCTNGTNVLLTLCNRPKEIERYKTNIVALEAIGMLNKTVNMGRVSYKISEKYEKYVDEYYRNKRKEEDEVKALREQTNKNGGKRT